MHSAELNVPQNHVYLFKPQSFFLFSANGFDRPAHKPIWYNIRPMTTYII